MKRTVAISPATYLLILTSLVVGAEAQVGVSRHDYSVGLDPISIATGDFNRDLYPDLVTANAGAATVTVLLNGTVVTRRDYTVGSEPCSVAVGDFNGDGYPDIAVALCAPVGAYGISVLLNNGDGTFAPAVGYAAGIEPTAIAVGDFNNDGRLDLAVANLCDNVEDCDEGTVSILLGHGDGTFGAPNTFLSGGPAPVSIAPADFRSDGNLDLVLANLEGPAPNTVSVLLGNGNGTFQPPVQYPVGTVPACAAVGDFNGDSKLDIVVANERDGTIGVLIGNGDGTFEPQVTFPAGTAPVWLTVGDFNGDGRLDVVTATGLADKVGLLLGNGDGTFAAPVSFAVGSDPLSIVASDFNRDGKLDVATANYDGSSATVLLNTGP